MGEAPSHSRENGKPFPALWPFAPGSGARLCSYLGVVPKEFWRRRRSGNFMTANLFPEPVAKWDSEAAGKAAWKLCAEVRAKHGHLADIVFVYLGRKVAQAMNFDHPFFTVERYFDLGSHHVVVPHPSGRSRIWNDKKNVAIFRKIMRDLGVL